MAKTVACSLKAEDLKLLDQIEGANVSEKLRNAIKLATSAKADAPKDEGQGEKELSEEEKLVAKKREIEAHVDGYEEGRAKGKEIEQELEEKLQLESEKFEGQCAEQREKIALLEKEVASKDTRLEKAIEDSFDLVINFKDRFHADGDLSKLNKALERDGKTWKQLDSLVRSYFLTNLAKHQEPSRMARDLGLEEKELERFIHFPIIKIV